MAIAARSRRHRMAKTAPVPARKFSGIMMSSDWPTASPAVKPKMRSAPDFRKYAAVAIGGDDRVGGAAQQGFSKTGRNVHRSSQIDQPASNAPLLSKRRRRNPINHRAPLTRRSEPPCLGRQSAGRPLPLRSKGCGRGKSGLHRHTVPDNVRRGRPQGKCHRERTAPASDGVRVKRCGKSAPRVRQRKRHGKPHREQNRIGTATRDSSLQAKTPQGDVRLAVRVGCSRPCANMVPEEWPSRTVRKRGAYKTRLTGWLMSSQSVFEEDASAENEGFGATRRTPRHFNQRNP